LENGNFFCQRPPVRLQAIKRAHALPAQTRGTEKTMVNGLFALPCPWDFDRGLDRVTTLQRKGA